MKKKKDKRFYWAVIKLLWNILILACILWCGIYTLGHVLEDMAPAPAEQPCDCPPPPPVDTTELLACYWELEQTQFEYQTLADAVDSAILKCDVAETLRIKNNR